MEMPPNKWNSEQVREGVDFNGINHFKMESLHFDTLDDFTSEQYLLTLPESNFGKSLSSESYNATFFPTDHLQDPRDFRNDNMADESNISDSFERPAKQLKTSTWNPSPGKQANVIPSSSSSQIISFSNVSSQTLDHQGSCGYSRDDKVLLPYEDLMDSNASYDNDNYTVIAGKPIRRPNAVPVKAPSHVQDHVIAERKRRERLTERFIALSAIVPGLKKLDKASVLGDAVKYLKQLQQRVELLEEQIKKKKKFEESPIVSQNDSSKLPAASEGYSSSCDDNSGGYPNKTTAEIEARILEKNVLIKIHCKKQKGFVSKMLSVIEQLHLTVISSNVLPFGDYAMDITVICQMHAECSLTVEELVRKLQSALQQYPDRAR
nr:PREDICTED: transcription factor bHLH18-like [Daucus carota subsp. sativus]